MKDASQIRSALLSWYRKTRRDLPWRRTRDPYAIWISETMLQQTRVETVIPYYERFLARFPDARSLAEAPADDVMSLWAGLGYYSRARNLQAAARQVCDEHGGRLPEDVDALQSLKGVGRYTAGAVASIAFDRPAPILDGNVIRVLARLLDLREDVAGAEVKRTLWAEAEALAEGPSPGDLNQALMELGALVCVPRAPRCLACPVMDRCAARREGSAESLPVKAKKPKPKRARAVCALVERAGQQRRFLAVRRPPSGLLGGLWELPGDEVGLRESGPEVLARALRDRVGLSVTDVEEVGPVRHVFTHRSLRLDVYRARTGPGRVAREGYDAHRWVSRTALDGLPISAVARKALDLLGDG